MAVESLVKTARKFDAPCPFRGHLSITGAIQDASELNHSPNLELRCGAVLGKRYRIESVLASGGMANIYVTHDLGLDRKAALKVLRPELGNMPEVIEHFLNEARVMARLRGAHIARVFDCGRIHHLAGLDLPFMILELLEGVDLLTSLQQNARFSEALTARYMLETCEGLAEAHALGIVHRDIKPENIFLARQVDGSFGVKLLDFGISKSLDDSRVRSLTTSKDLVGSPLYMSPEQMTAGSIDARTDIWALGAVMYECVAGTPAFGASTVCEICARVLTDPIPDLRQLETGISDEFARIVAGCLRRSPTERPQNVAELAAALEPIAAREDYSHLKRTAAVLGMVSLEQPAPVLETVLVEGSGVVNDTTTAVPTLRDSVRRQRRGWKITLATMALALSGAAGYSWYRFPQQVGRGTTAVYDRVVAWLFQTGSRL